MLEDISSSNNAFRSLESPVSTTSIEKTVGSDGRRSVATTGSLSIAASAAFDEIETLKKLIEMQRIHNYKQQEHIELVEGELQGTKDLFLEKQLELIKLRDEDSEKSKRIKDLEDELKNSQLERNAFQRFADQNKMLLSRLQSEKQAHSETRKELNSLKLEKSDYAALGDIRIQKAIENETSLKLLTKDLNDQLIELKQWKENAEKEIKEYKALIINLNQELKFSEERRSDETMRSRQIDYMTIRRNESIEQECQKLKDLNEELKLSTRKAYERGDVLQDRLAYTLRENEKYLMKLQEIDNFRRDNDKSYSIKEKAFIQKINILENEILYYKETHLKFKSKLNEMEESNVKLIETINNNNNENHLSTTGQSSLPRKSMLKLYKSLLGDRAVTANPYLTSRDYKPLHTAPLLGTSSSQDSVFHLRSDEDNPSTQNSSVSSELSPLGMAAISKDMSSSPSAYSQDHSHLNHGGDFTASSSTTDHKNVIKTSMSDEPHSHATSPLPTQTNDPFSSFEERSLSEQLEQLLRESQSLQKSLHDQIQGRKCLLSKYLRHFTAIYNTHHDLPKSVRSRALDLSRSGIADEDLSQVSDVVRFRTTIYSLHLIFDYITLYIYFIYLFIIDLWID